MILTSIELDPNSFSTVNNHWRTAFCCNGFLLFAITDTTCPITVFGPIFSHIKDRREKMSFDNAFSCIYP